MFHIPHSAFRIPRPALLAWLAALVALMAAWLLPLPRLVLSGEEQAAVRMPDNRTAVEKARADFERVQADYKSYVATHDVGAALTTFENALQASQADSSDVGKHTTVQAAALPIIEFMRQLSAYAEAGEQYLVVLRHYDDELMAWTRSLGPSSELLRTATWPIADHVVRYPPPIGHDRDSRDGVNISSAEVVSYTSSLQSDVAALNPSAQPNAISTGIYAAITKDIADIRLAGLSIQYIDSLHTPYYTILTNYDRKLQVVAASASNSNPSARRALLATSLNILLGVITLGGLAALFMPRMPRRKQEMGEVTP